MKVVHEFDDRGRHRLIVDGDAALWAANEHPAFWPDVDQAEYMGITNYYTNHASCVLRVGREIQAERRKK